MTVPFMKKCLLYFCLPFLCSGCTKLRLNEDPKYSTTRITAYQHLKATGTISYWTARTLLTIQDSVFYYQHYFGTTLGDSVSYIKWNDAIEEYEEFKILCDWNLVNDRVLNCLFRSYWEILSGENNRTYWRPLLWFNVDVHVKRQALPDTMVQYSYPFTSNIFN